MNLQFPLHLEWNKMVSAFHTIVGGPNYFAYLEHFQEHHPNEAPLTEKEFYEQRLKERYEGGKINRCC